MLRDVLYRIDHPALSGVTLLGGLIDRGAGFIGIKGSGPKLQGTLYFSPWPRDLPQQYRDQITVKGMMVQFPDGTEYPIYKADAERPSKKAERDQMARHYRHQFSAKAEEISGVITAALGDRSSPTAEKILAGYLSNLQRNPERDMRMPEVMGYLRGLEAASILSDQQRTELSAAFKELAAFGASWNSFSDSR
ncbi:hypothetical protein ABOC32_28600 [Pseudomonas sp. WOUb67]|uniref:hypothetical protein n=1 Tax=Pseudomonas sp. WOUb67 TaxID=3161136 RepID=UPI003CF4973F